MFATVATLAATPAEPAGWATARSSVRAAARCGERTDSEAGHDAAGEKAGHTGPPQEDDSCRELQHHGDEDHPPSAGPVADVADQVEAHHHADGVGGEDHRDGDRREVVEALVDRVQRRRHRREGHDREEGGRDDPEPRRRGDAPARCSRHVFPSSSRRRPSSSRRTRAGHGIAPAPAPSPALLYAANTRRIEARRERERVAESRGARRAADRLGELGRRAVDPLGQRLDRVVRVAPVVGRGEDPGRRRASACR